MSTTQTRYFHLVGVNAPFVVEFQGEQVVSTDGKIKFLHIKLDDSPGAGASYAFTLMVNAAPTALTLIISDAETSGEDTTHEIDVVGGDTISIRCVPSVAPAPTARFPGCTTVFEGSVANESLILAGTQNQVLNAGAIEYSQLMGDLNPTALENNARVVCPTSGNIKNLFIELSADPGTAPDAYRFTVRLNGATVAQSLIVTITANATTGSDLVHSLAVVAGDILTVMIEPLNGPTETPSANWGMTFETSIDGESIILSGSAFSPSDTNPQFNYPVSASATWSDAERLHLGQRCILKKLYILLDGPPGAGNKYDFTIRIAEADSNVTVEIADAATTGNSAALEDVVVVKDYVGFKCVPTSTPDTVDVYWGFVSFREPLGGGGAGAVVMGTDSLILDLLLEGVI